MTLGVGEPLTATLVAAGYAALLLTLVTGVDYVLRAVALRRRTATAT